MKILVTGTAGFIGFHLAKALLERGDTVVGIDNINDYYDANLKYARLAETGISRDAEQWHTPVISTIYPEYTFIRMNLEDREEMMELFKKEKFEKVVNLAAQAGVRFSLEDPHSYISSNIVGFLNILEACRDQDIKHLVYASSSSVYGNRDKLPLNETDNVDHPISIYAATKKSNELMAHTYSHLYNLQTTGLRFFTVYGPWGRPDMALFLFTKAILDGKPIEVFNNGEMFRDFTYIDDIIEGVVRILNSSHRKEGNISQEKVNSTYFESPYSLYNIGNSSSLKLTDFIEAIEKSINIKAKKKFMPIQPGDVRYTSANVDSLINDFNYKPSTSLDVGVTKFVRWYLSYYHRY